MDKVTHNGFSHHFKAISSICRKSTLKMTVNTQTDAETAAQVKLPKPIPIDPAYRKFLEKIT
uniref:Uncharacterized protein n=1 Tax=Romanomermis culicivorax TaxID=13658 RepID=A0A915HJL7_ROMCU